MKKLALIFLSFLLSAGAFAQRKSKTIAQQIPETQIAFDDSLFHGMQWRNIGPFRGGRSTTVCGVIQDPYTFYFGSTGGGVWKTTDGGANWRNVSDGHFKTGSVGAVAVAPSDPNVVYVGMGEAPIRGVMTSHGDGVYRSTDAGITWQHVGLEDARQIAKVRIHPNNPDLIYTAVQGSPYAPTEARGIYRSTNGGNDWEKVLYVDSTSGASDLSIDPNNPRILYAAFWDHQRLPWKMRSGGKGSGIWKSTNGGDTWARLSEGLPDSIMGKIGVVVSPAASNRVYAIIESNQGGLYRSDDAGKTWKLINEQRILRTRSWYYMHIFADPKNADKVFVLNAPFMRSIDGGKNFEQVRTPHGDNHDLWIHPENPMIMINANDGGANISYNGGKTWSRQDNQPTAQFYRVNADNQFPYYVYGGQQDNSTVATPSASQRNGIPYADFYRVGGCESAYTAFDPDDPRYVYAGCYQGIITEYDTKLKVGKDIMAYTTLGLGERPLDMKYRFNWNAPIIMSQHDKNVIYHTGNKVLRTDNRGIKWEEISPDLTKNEKEKQEWGGGPITNEGAGGENYNTIMYLAESPHNAQVLWVGSDDGLIHLTRDGGGNWENITPANLPDGMINSIEASPHQEGKAIVAFNRYKFNDFTPYIYLTENYGQTWREVSKGISAHAHVRVVREDPQRQGLLYAGTETGLYISFDDAAQWHTFQLNLPVVPITDMKIHQNDMVISTQGRAFWILDDLAPLQNWSLNTSSSEMALYEPSTVYLWGGGKSNNTFNMGTNPDFGLVAYHHVPAGHDTMEIKYEITDADGAVVKTFSNKAEKKENKYEAKPGLNKLVWNLQPDGVEAIKGLMTLGGNKAPRVGAGEYGLRWMVGTDTAHTSFEVMEDPRLEIDAAAFVKKRDWLRRLDDAATDLTETVKVLRFVKKQIRDFNQRVEIAQDTQLIKSGKSIIANIDSLENTLVQSKQKTFQDVINFPNQLDAKIRHIQSIIENSYPPITVGQETRAAEVISSWQEKKSLWIEMQGNEIMDFNEKITEKGIPFIGTSLPDKKVTKP